MGIHIQDEETVKAILEFARRRGLDISAAIRAAIEEAEAATSEAHGKVRGIEPVLERARARREKLGIPVDATFDLKALRDEIWGEAG